MKIVEKQEKESGKNKYRQKFRLDGKIVVSDEIEAKSLNWRPGKEIDFKHKRLGRNVEGVLQHG